MSCTLSQFCLPFDQATREVHFLKAIKHPRNNAGLASIYQLSCVRLCVPLKTLVSPRPKVLQSPNFACTPKLATTRLTVPCSKPYDPPKWWKQCFVMLQLASGVNWCDVQLLFHAPLRPICRWKALDQPSSNVQFHQDMI